MLRRDPTAHFVQSGIWPLQRYRFVTSELEAASPLSAAAQARLLRQQVETPVPVLLDEVRRRTWWMFGGEFYWEDEGFLANEVKALVRERLGQRDRRLRRAVALLEQEPALVTRGRERIDDGVRAFVWNRDGGRCVACGSRERLEFDHIIPVALGGASTARNLQLLCEACNRAKGASV